MTHISPTPHQKYIPIDERYKARGEYILDHITRNDTTPDDESMAKDSENVMAGDGQDAKDGNFEVLKDTSLNNSEGVVSSFSFKSKPKNTVYNLHILPKQFELLRKYLQNGDPKESIQVEAGDGVLKANKTDDEQENAMPIPVEVHARVLQRLNNVSGEHTFEGTKDNVSVVGADVEDRPKVVKKFSLADYKKKKIG